ncbi:hypothetical protein EBS80_04065, partial [bacterium]|nr:hypothetical protein [bacterium]
LHEAVHAWHALDLRYGLIEEGIALAVARLVARELGYADMLGENVVVSDRTRPLLASHPADLVDRFPPLNALRYAVIRDIWTACVERQSGTLEPLIAALRARNKETSFVEDYGDAIRSVDEETFAAITSRIVQPGNAWVGLLAKRKEAVPYLALCAFADLRLLRIVTGAKVPGTLDDRDRTIPIANDASFVGEGTCVLASAGKTVATVPFKTADGAVNVTLEQLPAGTYAATVSLMHPPISDTIEFTLT